MLCYWLTRLYLHLGCAEKIPNVAQTTGIVDIFDLRSGILGSTSQSFRTSKSSWMVDPTLPREMPSCSAIDLAEILWSSRIWSIISGVVTVLGRTERGTSQVEKLPRLKWATHFLTAYDGACSPNVFFFQNGMNFLQHLALQETKNLMTARIFVLWNRACRLTCLLSACNKKRLAIRHMNRPLFPTTLSHPTSGSRSG